MSIELGPLDLERISIESAVDRPRSPRAVSPLEQAEVWLRANPRGHIELTVTDDGFIATRSRIDTDTGEVAEPAR